MKIKHTDTQNQKLGVKAGENLKMETPKHCQDRYKVYIFLVSMCVKSLSLGYQFPNMETHY